MGFITWRAQKYAIVFAVLSLSRFIHSAQKYAIVVAVLEMTKRATLALSRSLSLYRFKRSAQKYAIVVASKRPTPQGLFVHCTYTYVPKTVVKYYNFTICNVYIKLRLCCSKYLPANWQLSGPTPRLGHTIYFQIMLDAK